MQWQKSDSLIHPLGLPTAHNSNGQKFPDLGCPMSIISQICRSPSSLKIKSKAVSKNMTSNMMLFSLLCSIQPNPTHQPLKVQLSALGYPSFPPPISPGSGLNWEICGWDSEGVCGEGESCFLKFYLPSSSGISAVLWPAFSFVV